MIRSARALRVQQAIEKCSPLSCADHEAVAVVLARTATPSESEVAWDDAIQDICGRLDCFTPPGLAMTNAQMQKSGAGCRRRQGDGRAAARRDHLTAGLNGWPAPRRGAGRRAR